LFFINYINIILNNIILHINEKDKLTVVEGTINVNKPTITGTATNAMAKALNDMGYNIGLAVTVTVTAVTGVGVAAKVLSKSAISPFQKVGVLIGSAVAGGAIHSGFSALSRIINNSKITLNFFYVYFF